jgi:conjugal transfer pilus assembly protein TraA
MADYHVALSYNDFLDACGVHSERKDAVSTPLQMELRMQSLTLPRRDGANNTGPSKFGRALNIAIPVAIAALAASAAYAGADTTFTPALTKFTDFLEGSGGKIITVLSLAGGLIGLASGRFSLGQVAVPVGVGIGVGTGVPIVTSVVTAII